jgi:hypothetical protein
MVFGADTLPAGVVAGGAVPKLKKSLLCINVQPFMLVYGSCINAILSLPFVSSIDIAEILLPQFI